MTLFQKINEAIRKHLDKHADENTAVSPEELTHVVIGVHAAHDAEITPDGTIKAPDAKS